MRLNLILLVFVLFRLGHLSAGESTKENPGRESKAQEDVGSSATSNLLKRQTDQTNATATPKPKKPRPSNIFSLVSVLLTETREDANRAFNEIGTLFNSQFSNATTAKAPTTTTTTTTTASAPSPSDSSSSENDEDNEITTTTEAYRITRDEFLGILRSNVQGLVNLFGKEFRVAIQDSNQNVREFGRGLGAALRPYFNNNNSNNNNNNNNTRNNSSKRSN